MKGVKITNKAVIYNDMERGWYNGNTQPLWHKKVYGMWRRIWHRVYSDRYYFGSLIDPSFQYLSNFVEWIEQQPRFEEFCATCNKISWSIDKDSKRPGNRNYYPEYMALTTQSDNSIERINRRGNPTYKQPVLGISLDDTKGMILTVGLNDVKKHGFIPSHVGSCIAKKQKTHKNYKWYKVSYKHDKKYRRVII